MSIRDDSCVPCTNLADHWKVPCPTKKGIPLFWDGYVVLKLCVNCVRIWGPASQFFELIILKNQSWMASFYLLLEVISASVPCLASQPAQPWMVNLGLCLQHTFIPYFLAKAPEESKLYLLLVIIIIIILCSIDSGDVDAWPTTL